MFSNKTKSKLHFKNAYRMKVTLSDYFPAGTQFYYGYPAGEDSGFLNHATPATQELIAARAFGFAGNDVSVIAFASTASTKQSKELYDELNIPQLRLSQTITFPKSIDGLIGGHERNHAIKAALKRQVTPGSLVMAQPYTDKDLSHLFQISPELTTWLNDKSNMGEYIGSEYLPKRLGLFENGIEFNNNVLNIELPAVVKATSSSSGDGVYMCKDQQHLEVAAKKLKNLDGAILVEELVNYKNNYGVHFGVHQSKKMPVDLLGINEQITTKDGEFVGGIITSTSIPAELSEPINYLLETVLPKVREMGWYGIGGFDILTDDTGKAYFIDCNFRMTGMSAYHFMIANKVVEKPICSLSAEFEGTATEFKRAIFPFASKLSANKFLQLIVLSHHDNVWRFNAALSFTNNSQLIDRAKLLLESGLKSRALEQIIG